MRSIQLLAVIVPVFAVVAALAYLRDALSLSSAVMLFYAAVACVEISYLALLTVRRSSPSQSTDMVAGRYPLG